MKKLWDKITHLSAKTKRILLISTIFVVWSAVLSLAILGASGNLTGTMAPSGKIYYVKPDYNSGNAASGVKNMTTASLSSYDYRLFPSCGATEEVILDGTYVVTGEKICGNIVLEGSVNLILLDGAKLTVNASGKKNISGIDVYGFYDFKVYAGASSENVLGTGVLDVTGGESGAGIGSGETGYIEINGGTVIARGGAKGAGIGADGSDSSTASLGIVINGGSVKAYGGTDACGIGAGAGKNSCAESIVLNGTDIYACGGGNAHAIGGGNITLASKRYCVLAGDEQALANVDLYNPQNCVMYFGGEQKLAEYAKGYRFAQIGESMTSFTYLDENGDKRSVAYYHYLTSKTTELTDGWWVSSGNITCGNLSVSGNVKLLLADGSSLTATGAANKAGITVTGENRSLTVYGGQLGSGKLTANGGANGAGIGGDANTPGQNITVIGGNVTAQGGQFGAGIGGGCGTENGAGSGINITIHGGTVVALGGQQSAGIGGGGNQPYTIFNNPETDTRCRAENILITGGNVKAVGGAASTANRSYCRSAPGIGGGVGQITVRGLNYVAGNEGVTNHLSVVGGTVELSGTKDGQNYSFAVGQSISNFYISTDLTVCRNEAHEEIYYENDGSDLGSKLNYSSYLLITDRIVNPNVTATYQIHAASSFLKLNSDITLSFKWSDFATSDFTQYNPTIAQLYYLLCLDAHDIGIATTQFDSNTDEGNNTAFPLSLGFNETKQFEIVSKNGLDTDDYTVMTVSLMKFKYNGKTYNYINVSCRGTLNNAEWASNFDIGADTDQYINVTGEHPEWTVKANHKGFDVTANRCIAELMGYLSDKGLVNSKEQVVIGICGYSRGAAVANLMAAKFGTDEFSIGKNATCHAYTFASPNTTTADESVATSADYNTIFNIVNTDDAINQLPPVNLGFRKYGTTLSFSLNNAGMNGYKTAYRTMTGEAFNADGMAAIVTCMNQLCATREEYYEILSIDGRIISGTATESEFNTMRAFFKANAGENWEKYVSLNYTKGADGTVSYSYCYSTAFVGKMLPAMLNMMKDKNYGSLTGYQKYFGCSQYTAFTGALLGLAVSNPNGLMNMHLPVPYLLYTEYRKDVRE